jgi:tetratricopeptide (TPR) repeat protein
MGPAARAMVLVCLPSECYHASMSEPPGLRSETVPAVSKPGSVSPGKNIRWIRRPVVILGILAALAVLGWAGPSAYRYALARYHFNAGKEALARYHTSRAKLHLEKVLAVWPADPEALLLSVQIARREHAFERALRLLEDYKTACGQDDDWAVERLITNAARGQPDVKYCFTLLAKDHPKTDLIFESLVIGAYYYYQVTFGETYLDLWFKKQPDNPLAFYYRGQGHQFTVHPQEAAEAFRRAVEIDPDFDEARLRLAESFLDLVQTQDAMPHLEFLARRLPDSGAVQLGLGLAQVQLRERAKAEKYFVGASTLSPGDHVPLLERAKLILNSSSASKDELNEADQLLEKARILAEDDVDKVRLLTQGHLELYRHLLVCQQRLGQVERAKQTQERLGQMEFGHKRLQEIVARQFPFQPRDPDLAFEVGMISMGGGATKEALAWFDRALQFNQNHAPTHKALAGYYQKLGQMGLALRHWEMSGGQLGKSNK